MLLDGKAVAASIDSRTAQWGSILKELGVVPSLAIVSVGDNDKNGAYERSIIKKCEKIGVRTLRYKCPESLSGDQFKNLLGNIREDGCIVMRPLPSHLNKPEIYSCIRPDQDVDGITDASLAWVFTGRGVGFPPCTAQSCMELLSYYGMGLSGKRVSIIGRSLVVGKPLAVMMDRENATVTLCHSKTNNLEQICKESDIIVSAVGKPGFLPLDCFRDGQIVLDVGISYDNNGKICGDIDFAAIENRVAGITPVPGGIGAVTTSVLMSHVVEAAKKRVMKG